jgi:dihydroxy-acid dehydratase
MNAPARKLRSNFPRGSYLWAVRNAQWQAMGIPEEDCEKPKIAVVNSSSELAACYSHLDQVAKVVKEAIRAAGGVPFEIRTAAPSDFVTGAGARGAYMLAARDLVTNDIEAAVEGRAARWHGVPHLLRQDRARPADGRGPPQRAHDHGALRLPGQRRVQGQARRHRGGLHPLDARADRRHLHRGGDRHEPLRDPFRRRLLGPGHGQHDAYRVRGLGMALPGSAPVAALSDKMFATRVPPAPASCRWCGTTSSRATSCGPAPSPTP